MALPSCLLLPPPPSPATPESLAAAYRPAITATVSVLRDHSSKTELTILLPIPSVHDQLDAPRSVIFSETQALLAGVYSLVCVVCAKLKVDVETGEPGSVDARIVLLDYATEGLPVRKTGVAPVGPIIDLQTFALTRRDWEFIFSMETEECQRLLAEYTNIANSVKPPLRGQLKSVGRGTSLVVKPSQASKPTQTKARNHHVVAVGGTFDHIHAGHKLLLTATALVLQPSTQPRRLIVGITGDELLKNKKYSQFLGSWKQRQEDVVQFLLSVLLFTSSKQNVAIEHEPFDTPVPNGKGVRTHLKESNITIECCEIQDPFGPTITDEAVSALVVSAETRSGGQAVNKERAAKGWKELEVLEIDVLDAHDAELGPTKTEDFASKISSTAIRKRLADGARTSSL